MPAGAREPTDTIVSLDTASGEWDSTLAPMPTARGLLCAAVTGGDTIWALGGRSNPPTADPFDTVEAYDIAGNTWREGPPMLSARQEAAAVYVEAANRVYVLGGYGLGGGDPGSELGTVESLDVATGEWRAELPMPTPRAGASERERP
eukprot:SAG22_NODE_453_length_10316_cov_27.583341_10_plen_148_part_00